MNREILEAIGDDAKKEILSLMESVEEFVARERILNNPDGTGPPTVNDDITLGYSKGSFWAYDSRGWFCTNNSEGAAVWLEL